MTSQSTPSEMGYLTVRASTALGAIPLENAAVTVRGIEEENKDVVYSLKTNSDGQTEKIALPAPPRKNSEAPSIPRPFSLYSVNVFAEGYAPLYVESVPIFSSVLSVQPAVLVPLLEGERERK